MADRFVLLGLANAQSPWFRNVGRWANVGAIPADFVKCLTAAEVRHRLESGRPFSAVLVDGSLRDADRDFVDLALESGAAVFVIDDRRTDKNWLALGASRVLPGDFSRGDLLEALDDAAQPITRADRLSVSPIQPEPSVDSTWSGRVIAVTGAGGTGKSTLAMALAAALSKDPRFRQLVLLADLALDAEQAVLHDARDVMPGLEELAEAFRTGAPSAAEIRSMVFATDRGDYQLLLGLRRHRDWAGIRPRAFESAIRGLMRTYRLVVVDTDADVEGDNETGVLEIEDRNVMARTALNQASLTVLVGNPGLKGLHSMVRTTSGLLDFGVDGGTILPVINKAPKSNRQRAELSATFAELLDAERRKVPSPVFVPYRKRTEQALRDGTPLPQALGRDLARGVLAVLGHLGDAAEESADEAVEEQPDEPERIEPGSLGEFFDQDADDDDDPDFDEAEGF